MSTAAVTLTETEHSFLNLIAHQMGKTEAEVLQEAVQSYIAQFQHANRKQLLQQARGMWQYRSDLPDAVALRREFERNSADQ